MRTVGRIWIVFLLASCAGRVDEGEASEPEKIVARFFDSYQSEGPKSAVNRLLLTNKYISEQSVDSAATQLERWAKDFDNYQGYEVTKIKKYGQGVLFITCVAKHSRLPIRFNFTFYNPGNGWRIQYFNYQTDFLKELEGSD
ncbi:MAG TPA: hypothetical protein VF473_04025 [Cyclobacteriaceae bacterium]